MPTIGSKPRTVVKPVEIRSQLRIWEPEELAELSEAQLKRFASRSHRARLWGIRSGIVVHARNAGAALNEIKERLGHGNWGGWLSNKSNWEPSPETAEVYMRVAREWPKIVAAGLDKKPDLTLEECRAFLAKKAKPGKPTLKLEESTDAELNDDCDLDNESDELDDEETRTNSQVEMGEWPVRLVKPEIVELKKIARFFRDDRKLETDYDAILSVMRPCYDERMRQLNASEECL